MSKPASLPEIQRRSAEKAHQASLGEHKKLIQRYEQTIEDLQNQLGVVLNLESNIGSPQPLQVVDRDGSGQAAAVVLASDWHSEETIDPKTINGMNEYNLTIAQARIERFFQGIVKLVRIERAGVDINVLVLALLGDLMTGYIHEELQEGNGLSPTETIIWLQHRLIDGIEYLKKEGGFERIIIPCTVGNHGRTTKKMRVATSTQNSYEWLLYKFLESRIDGVEWHVAEGYHVYLNVYGKTLRFHHGDNIEYKGGVGGLTIPTEKKISSWDKAKRADIDCFGHYHVYQQNPKWCSNGSIIGFGPYSLKIGAAYEPPSQTFFLLDSKRGRTGTWPIFV
jgi:hypothetical protein